MTYFIIAFYIAGLIVTGSFSNFVKRRMHMFRVSARVDPNDMLKY